MNRTSAFVAAALLAASAWAQDVLVPPEALILENVPPIPADLAPKLRPYGEFRPHGMLSWHPTKRELLVRRRLNATTQVHSVTAPLTTPLPLTDFPNAVNDATFEPTRGQYFVFPMGEGGNEVYRLNRFDLATRASTPLSPDGQRAGTGRFNRKGDRLVYTTVLIDKNNPDRNSNTTLHLVDPLKPQSDKALAHWDQGTWGGFRFSEDGKRLVFLEFVSVNESYVWVMDVASGKKRRVTAPGKDGTVYYDQPEFARDGRGVYAISDRDSEFRRLVYLPLDGKPERALTPKLAFDVEDIEISHDAGMIAFVTNEKGSSVLRFYDVKAGKELPRPPLVDGVIGGLEWRPKSSEIAFHITSARTAGDVFSYDVRGNRLTRWTNGNNPEVNTSEFAEPRIVKWKSFDGREISGLHYHPDAKKFSGKRPVIVNIHGGPEGQSRPTFIGRNNYFVSELGVAMIYPNVRGSTGFGKTFVKLDNGRLREDSVKDIGALLDWIKDQPDLDANKVMVLGGSYGGYMTLASAVHFSDRIAGAVDVVGISSFVTFLERTESYRRDLRRVEYGDERDADMRAFLDSISPLTHADKIGKPLLVAQGFNDPRVPRTEAEQIVAALKKRGTPVWFIMARDEGHGFAKKPNADYLFYAMVEFARRILT